MTLDFDAVLVCSLPHAAAHGEELMTIFAAGVQRGISFDNTVISFFLTELIAGWASFVAALGLFFEFCSLCRYNTIELLMREIQVYVFHFGQQIGCKQIKVKQLIVLIIQQAGLLNLIHNASSHFWKRYKIKMFLTKQRIRIWSIVDFVVLSFNLHDLKIMVGVYPGDILISINLDAISDEPFEVSDWNSI